MAKTTKKNGKKDVAKKTADAVSTDVTMDFAADAGMGMEGADAKSFAIPFLTILQGLSPQMETVEGAKPGLICNTITDELMTEVEVIPCSFQRRFLRWAPREDGGGFKGEYNPVEVETGEIEGIALDENGRPTLEGDELKDTRHHFVLMRAASGAWQPALMAMASTQIKKSKRFMSLIQGIEMRTAEGKAFNPPSFSHVYKVGSVKEENNQGSWWGYTISLVGPVEDGEVYAKAKAFHADVTQGNVKTDQPVDEGAAGSGDERF